jgi:hypothetical protein
VIIILLIILIIKFDYSKKNNQNNNNVVLMSSIFPINIYTLTVLVGCIATIGATYTGYPEVATEVIDPVYNIPRPANLTIITSSFLNCELPIPIPSNIDGLPRLYTPELTSA